jgi:hypothetical protein
MLNLELGLTICLPEHHGQVSIFNPLHESNESASQVSGNQGVGVETVQQEQE